jgi:hypothetical protein
MSEKKEVDLKKIASDLEIDKPIVSYRMVGSRVEVYVLGGEMLVWPGADKERPEEVKKEPGEKKAAKGKKK